MRNILPNQIVVEGKKYDLMSDTTLAQFTDIDTNLMVVYVEFKPSDEYTGNSEDYKKKLLKFNNSDPEILIYEVLDWLIDSQIIMNLNEQQNYFMNEYFPKREYYKKVNKISSEYNELIYQDPGKAIEYIKKEAEQLDLSENELMNHIDQPDFYYDDELMDFLFKNNPGMIRIKNNLLERRRDSVYDNLIDSQALRIIPLDQIDSHFPDFLVYALKSISDSFNERTEFFKDMKSFQGKGKVLVELFFGKSGCDLNAEYFGEEVYREAFIGLNILHRTLPDSSYLKYILENNGGSYACKMLLELDPGTVDGYFNYTILFQNLNIDIDDLVTLFLFYNFENRANPAAINFDGENSCFFWSEFVSDNNEDINELEWYKNNRFRIEKFGEHISDKGSLPQRYFDA